MLTVKENITNALTWFYKKIKLNYLDVIREKLDEFITGHADVFLMDDEGNVYMDEDDTGYVYSWDSSVFARRDTVSDVFDRDKNYSAGDYCIYNNTLYKFIADKEKGIWDDDAVEAVNVTDELKEKEEEITQNTDLIQEHTDLINSLESAIPTVPTYSMQSFNYNTVSFSAGSGTDCQFTISTSGTILGMVGYNCSNASSGGQNVSQLAVYGAYITSGGTVHIKARNNASATAVVDITVYILIKT